MKIGIDPGHGGQDPGAIGKSSRLKESLVNLDIAKTVRQLLEAEGHTVVITRTEDIFVPLFQRTREINRAKCDYAVSVHVNASPDSGPRYLSAFVQGPGGKAARLASRILNRLVAATGWPDGGVRVKNLHMTRETRMPTCLLELGFISNQAEEASLSDPGFRNKLAEAIASGIEDYLAALKPAGTAN